MAKFEELKNDGVFPVGEKNDAYAQYFIGQSYLQGLVSPEDNIDFGIGNVTFEPGCRNDWHIHHDGFQILLVTGGEGWYQEWGKSAQLLKKGDVVVIKEGVKHWHGATADSWFSHVAITKGTSEWLEKVTDAEYAKLG
ncbi:cupin domain-containing protein [Companilactobacillus furfuricola]|uniref:cupin domain-containing protein n=1 Tax=Companilactobacillus furfuricola TaxID=1462575 RepID=UPI000F7905F9|nr:cupin domain-containing protein [Companilactobacillus furfuricola]